MFPTNNVWNTRVDQLPVDANSAAYVSSMGPESDLHPDYGVGGGTNYTLVNGSQAKVNVSFNYTSDPGPYPIPNNVQIESGSDHHALIVDTTNCILYELFGLVHQSNGSWTAGSGAIYDMRSNALRAQGLTSADAAGLPMLPGLVRYDEVLAGHINHAIRFTAIPTRDTHIWPARHDASSYSSTQYPQFGQRFRLKASYDISSFAPHVQVILTALKEYGMILADNGTSWHISGVGDSRINDDEMHQLTRVVGNNFEAVNESSLIVNVDSGQAGGSAPPSGGGGSVPTGWVSLVSKNSGKCLELATNSVAQVAEQSTCTGSYDQQFQFSPVSGGYKVSVRSSGLQLDVSGGPSSLTDGALIIQYPFWGGTNEVWDVTSLGGGEFKITALSSGKCLDVSHISLLDGAIVHQWGWLSGANQEWSFVPHS